MKENIYSDYEDDGYDNDSEMEESEDSRSTSRQGKLKNSLSKRRKIERYMEKRHLKKLMNEVYRDNDVNYDFLFE